MFYLLRPSAAHKNALTIKQKACSKDEASVCDTEEQILIS